MLTNLTILKDVAVLPVDIGMTTPQEFVSCIFSYLINDCMVDESGETNQDYVALRDMVIDSLASLSRDDADYSTKLGQALAQMHS